MFADLHGDLPKIPRASRNSEAVIVLCGDICPNFTENFTPGIKSGDTFTPSSWNGYWNFRQIDKRAEAMTQNKWVEEKLLPHLVANGIDLNNVIAVRGNHDWADLERFFPNSLNIGAKVITVQGVKIGLLSGSLWFTGEWQDEVDEFTINERLLRLDKDIQMLVSHQPPYGIKDRGHGEAHAGSQSIYMAIFGKSLFDQAQPYFTDLKIHVFGHLHDSRGAERHEVSGRQVIFYNAARTRFTVDTD